MQPWTPQGTFDYMRTLEANLRRLEQLRSRLSHNPILTAQLQQSIQTVRIQLQNERQRARNVLPFRPHER
jgi:TolA-binding protein